MMAGRRALGGRLLDFARLQALVGQTNSTMAGNSLNMLIATERQSVVSGSPTRVWRFKGTHCPEGSLSKAVVAKVLRLCDPRFWE
jgi:hypothetical protein